MHVGAGGTVGQPERRMAASVASRYALGADGVGAARPGARGSRVTASRYTLGAEGGGAARPGAYMCSPRNCARCLLGESGDVEDVVRCALLERLGARRASSSCRGRGWGGTPRGPCCHRLRHARAERRYGGSWHTRAARERRRRRSKVSRRRCAGRAPPARRGRRVRVPRAFKRPAKTLWWVVRTPTPNYLRLASPDRGKYSSWYMGIG